MTRNGSPLGRAPHGARAARSTRTWSLALIHFAAVGCCTDYVQTAAAEPFDAYEIVTEAAVTIAPEPLRSFLQQQRDDLVRAALSHCIMVSTTAERSKNDEEHFVLLDLAAESGSREARDEAARRFPRDRSAAKRLAREKGVDRAGSLPWVIQDHYHQLVNAFRSGDGHDVLSEAGAILHFVTDAVLPLSSQAPLPVGNPTRASDTETDSADPTPQYRRLIDRIAELKVRLSYEVRVSPMRYRRLDRPLDAIFDTLVDSHSRLAVVSDSHNTRSVDDDAAWLESRLEAGALLGANLIGTAWLQAGLPTVTMTIATNGEPQKTAADAPSKADDVLSENDADPPAEASFVGSRSSTIFHRSGCSHAKRIRRENLVNFQDSQSARRAGRKPCKSCQPGG